MEKEHAVELLRQSCRLTRRFALQVDVPVLAFSNLSSTSLTSVHRHSKCTRKFLTEDVSFARSGHQRFPRISRAPKARAKKNWRFAGNIAPNLSLNAALGFVILKCWKLPQFIILASSLYKSLHLWCFFSRAKRARTQIGRIR